MEKDRYEFDWTTTDQERLLKLSDELDKEITLQSLSEMLPVVMMMDASPWAIFCVIGQLGPEEAIRLLPRNGTNAMVENMEMAYREAHPVMFLS